jgi:hypothetical protein
MYSMLSEIWESKKYESVAVEETLMPPRSYGLLVARAVELKAMTIWVVESKIIFAPGFECRWFLYWQTSFFELLLEDIRINRIKFEMCRPIFQQAQASVANGEQGEYARPMYQDLHPWKLGVKL